MILRVFIAHALRFELPTFVPAILTRHETLTQSSTSQAAFAFREMTAFSSGSGSQSGFFCDRLIDDS
jgi:hypothetical protein